MKWNSPFGRSTSANPTGGAGSNNPSGGISGGAWSLGPASRTREDDELLAQVASYVVRRGLGTPAIFFLESAKPMSFVGSQALVFFEPFIRVFLSTERYQRFASLMEHRDNFEYMIRQIEASESALAREQKEAKRAAREQKEIVRTTAEANPARGRSGTRRWRRIWEGRFRSR